MSAPEAVLEQHRPMLFGLAYRLLGSRWDAEDVLQEAYLRWRDADRDEVREPRRYLSRVVTRLAMDRLRVRGRHEDYVGTWLPQPVVTDPSPFEPLTTVELRDSVSMATLHLMERLNPLERAVFVLRSAFDLPYAEIGEILERSPEHCRQLHRRAEARLADERARFNPSRREHTALLQHFLDAARDGNLAGLTALLRDDVVLWSDGGGRARAARRPIEGPAKTARFMASIYARVTNIDVVELNGSPAAVVTTPRSRHTLSFAVDRSRISALYLVSNPDKLPDVDNHPGA